MVSIGKMQRRVRFEKNEPVNIPGGPGRVDQYAEFLTTAGHLEKNSGNRILSLGEITEDNRYRLRVRFETTLYNELFNASVKSLRVLIDDNRVFTISSWKKVEEKRAYIEMMLNEQR